MEISFVSRIVQEFGQLAPLDALTVGTLAVLEGILSVDNALVLAILVRGLPKAQQKKALTYGIAGAFIFRLIALIFATHLMRFILFKLIGGGYLIYLAMKHLFFFQKEDAHQTRPSTATNFWRTVLVVELTDIAFSIDSITTAVAMTDKLLVVWVGGVLGIVFLRFAAGMFVRLLEKLPRLEDLAYQLIFFIGTKLALEGFRVEIEHGIFWLTMGIIAILGSSLVYRDYYQRRTRTEFRNRLLDRLEKGEMTPEEVLAQEYIPREAIELMRNRGWLVLRRETEVFPSEPPVD
jgi:YkoY family integral membrane protein